MSVDAGRLTAIGAFDPGTSVLVAEVGTTTAANIYTDKSSGTAAANPVIADASGSVGFFAVAGDYDLVIGEGDLSTTVTVTVRPDPSQSWPG